MRTKKLIFGLGLVILLFPLLNTMAPFIKSAGLKGAVTKVSDVNFTWNTWFNGTYQQKKEDYINSNVGFYPDFIRINNQIDFSLFGVLHAKDVFEGENHFLYEGPYIKSYLGMDKLKDDTILKACLDIKWIQDSLTALGKKFLFVIATNKAFYYPQHIPNQFKQIVQKFGNYQYYLHYFDSLGISYIDFNGYFISQKSKTPYPLITKFSTHWSSYGASIAADSIVEYLSLKYYKNQLVKPKINYIESETYNSHDKEAFEPLNLIFGWPDKELTAWPQYTYQKNSETILPKILIIADSYFWEIYDQKVMENVFSDHQIWYYNREHWGKKRKFLGDETTHFKLGNDYLKNSEIVVLLASEYHLNCLSEDFIKKMKKVYRKSKS